MKTNGIRINKTLSDKEKVIKILDNGRLPIYGNNQKELIKIEITGIDVIFNFSFIGFLIINKENKIKEENINTEILVISIKVYGINIKKNFSSSSFSLYFKIKVKNIIKKVHASISEYLPSLRKYPIANGFA